MSIISNKDQRMIRLAAREAAESSCGAKLGAVLTMSGRVIDRASNTARPFEEDTEPYEHSVHAEMNLLRRYAGRARGGTIYVARIKADGTYGNSMPCGRCMSSLFDESISRVLFTTSDSAIHELRLNKLEPAPYREAAKLVKRDAQGVVRNIYVPPKLAVAV